MAINNFSSLKDAVQNWTADSSTSFSNRLNDFVRLGEERIFFGSSNPLRSRPVRVRDMETSADIAITSGTGPLPDRYLEFRRLYWDADPRITLEFIPPRRFHGLTDVNESGEPRFFTIEANTILLAPSASGTVKSVHFQRFNYLSADDDTNALLTDKPAIYLYAALIEAWGYKRNNDRVNDALQRYIAASSGAGLSDLRARYTGSSLNPHIESGIA